MCHDAPGRHGPEVVNTPAGDRTRRLDGAAPFLTLGLQLAAAVVAFFFLGRWLDGLWGTGPWLMITGLAIGTAGGLTKFFHEAIALGKKADDEARDHEAR